MTNAVGSCYSMAARQRVSRRMTMLGVATMSIAIASRVKAAHPGLSVGAIRWDAWYEPTDGGVRAAVERSLGPAAFHGRAPSCATSSGADQISFAGCDNQARMDYEIGEAHRAGLDYWAYCWYSARHEMQEAWRLHQASAVRAQMGWCLLFSSPALFASEAGGSASQTLVGYLSQPNYRRVSAGGSGRPLVYVLAEVANAGGLPGATVALRSACKAQGVASPYVVLLGAGPASQWGAAQAAGADAVGVYAAGQPGNSSPYTVLAQAVQSQWAAMAGTGQEVIPTAMTGLDRRPRIQTPVPWEKATPENFRKDNFFQPGTPAQIAAHVGAMLGWIRANRVACPAQTGLIYSWDEHDEGGSCLNPSVAGGDAVLAAVSGVL
jgi:hypothetical protein